MSLGIAFLYALWHSSSVRSQLVGKLLCKSLGRTEHLLDLRRG